MISVFRFCEFQRCFAIGEQAATRPILFLRDPVSPAVTADHENRRPQKRERFGYLFNSFHDDFFGEFDADILAAKFSGNDLTLQQLKGQFREAYDGSDRDHIWSDVTQLREPLGGCD